ncbi:MAG: Cupin 4 family protein, partial [Marmoricola sp.]|nr:Cupin 4 family protein [Marmoricola sp.]
MHPAPGEDATGPREVLLEPGLSLYLPTGTPHAARAQDAVSL